MSGVADDVEELTARLDELETTYGELAEQMADPAVHTDPRHYAELAQRYADLTEVVEAYRAYRQAVADAAAARELAGEASGGERDSWVSEAESHDAAVATLSQRLKVLLLPKDPLDEKNVIVELRAGAGGDEAGLFASELFRMYARYAERAGWRIEELTSAPQGVGGVKEVFFQVKGRGAYSRLKHESGVHRVQRVPETESSGRIHTSTASVAVMAEAEEIDVEVDPNDLRMETFRSSGPGGQSVNTTDSAVRLIHEPTGLVVACQDEKSQVQNREKAMRIMRARLLQAEQEQADKERADDRAAQIGSGDRSEKVRTYNFPQHRLTDHRIHFTTHRLSEVLDGELDELIEALSEAEQRQRLEALAAQEATA
jgi:peptide chain release factor 1